MAYRQAADPTYVHLSSVSKCIGLKETSCTRLLPPPYQLTPLTLCYEMAVDGHDEHGALHSESELLLTRASQPPSSPFCGLRFYLLTPAGNGP